MLLRTLAAGGTVLALAACGGGAKKATPASGLPPGCAVSDVDTIVNAFLANPSAAPAGQFDVVGFNESDGRKVLLRTPARAVAYLRRRQSLGERDRLIELRVAKGDFNHVRVTFQLTRYAPDFLQRGIHTRLARGAGTIDCAHQKVAAWVVKGP